MRKIKIRQFLIIIFCLFLLISCQKDDPKLAEVNNLKVKRASTKINYYEGEVLDLSGLIVTLTLDNNETEDVAFEEFASKEISCNPLNKTVLDEFSEEVIITHACSGNNVIQSISVSNNVTEINIKTLPTKVDYYIGEVLDLKGLIVTLIMDNDASKDILFSDFSNAGLTCFPFNEKEIDSTLTTVTITHDTSGKNVTQIINVLTDLTDLDGNTYSYTKIGNQIWMAENLKTTHYGAGAEITLVESEGAWENLSYSDKAYCLYDNSSDNGNTYGLLYTWAAAKLACPDGWHLPSEAEWMELIDYVSNDGYTGMVGTALKSTSGWNNGDNGIDNYSFNAKPGGERDYRGILWSLVRYAHFWSATAYSSDRSWNYQLYYNSDVITSMAQKNHGLSVRCIRD